MTFDFLLQALALTFGELAFGFLIIASIVGLLVLIAWVQKDGPERERPERTARAWPVDFASEIRAYRCRRDAEFMAGPEGRDRLPMTGRRVA